MPTHIDGDKAATRTIAHLQQQRAILLGDFQYESANGNGYNLNSVVDHFRERLSIPILTGLPFGHIRDKLTLPIGAVCRLTVTNHEFTLKLSDYPHRAA